MEKVKVLHIFRNLEFGGAQKLIIDLYQNIDHRTFQFDFLVSDLGAYDQKVLDMGCKIFKVSYLTKVGQARYKKELKNFFHSHKEYQIVHSHIDQVSGIIMQSAEECNIKHRISHSHNTRNSNKLLGKLYKFYLQRKILKYATGYIACSKEAAKWLFREKRKKAFILNNGIQIEKFTYNDIYRKEIRDEFHISDDTVIIGNVGRLTKQKNQMFLLDIFKEYLKMEQHSCLILIGDGKLRKKLENRAKVLNIIENTIFIKNREDIYKFYSAFDVMIMPSIYEGNPIVLIEGVVAGCKSIIQEDLKISFDKEQDNISYIPLKENKIVWAKEILNVLKKERKKCRDIDSKYDIKIVAKELEDYYIKLDS